MTPIGHPTSTRVLGPPAGVDCNPLAITDCELAGREAIASHWMPDAEELAALNAGGSVVLIVQGHTHAPLFVGAAHSFKPT